MSATVLECDAPESDVATLEYCLFCVASYHFGREALRVTVDAANDSYPEVGCQAGFWHVLRTLVNTSDDAGMAGTTGDVIWGELFSWQVQQKYNTVVVTRHTQLGKFSGCLAK